MDVLNRAIAHWGADTQTDKAIEEMGELLQAIMKYRHKGHSPERLASLLEEIADVEIMMTQLRTIYDKDIRIPAIKEYKMNRLDEILSVGNY